MLISIHFTFFGPGFALIWIAKYSAQCLCTFGQSELYLLNGKTSKISGSGGIQTHASEETGALNQRLICHPNYYQPNNTILTKYFRNDVGM